MGLRDAEGSLPESRAFVGQSIPVCDAGCMLQRSGARNHRGKAVAPNNNNSLEIARTPALDEAGAGKKGKHAFHGLWDVCC